MSKFYRIQNKEGQGPYSSAVSLRDSNINWENYSENKHPAPCSDSLLWQNLKCKLHCGPIGHPDVRPFIFGFSSIDQLRAWFFNDEVIKWMVAHGFSLWESGCEPVQGNSQAVLLKSEFDSQSKREVPLLSLLESK